MNHLSLNMNRPTSLTMVGAFLAGESPDLKGVLEFMLSHAAARHSDVQLK